MLQGKIEVNGETEEDMIIALEEVMKKIKEGYTSGFDSNETSSYEFEVKEF